MWVYHTLLVFGLAGSSVSMYQTLAFSRNPAFDAPALAEGPRHTNYVVHVLSASLALGAVVLSRPRFPA